MGREKSIKALQSAMDGAKKSFLLLRRLQVRTSLGLVSYKVGTVASILQLLKLPDGTEVLIEGAQRTRFKF